MLLAVAEITTDLLLIEKTNFLFSSGGIVAYSVTSHIISIVFSIFILLGLKVRKYSVVLSCSKTIHGFLQLY